MSKKKSAQEDPAGQAEEGQPPSPRSGSGEPRQSASESIARDGGAGEPGQGEPETLVGQEAEVGSIEDHALSAETEATLTALTAEPEVAEVSAELKAIVEALIFASPEPLTPKALFKLMAEEPKEDIQAAIAELKKDYDGPGGLQFVEVAGGYQIVTRTDLHEWVRKLFHERSSQKLTIQALETLAVIAYKQPITALEIAEVRGVNTSGVVSTLLERHLVKIVGRKQVVGRPFMYATTKEFLIRFGLNDITDLPKVEDMAGALGVDMPLLVEQTPTEDLLPIEEPEAGDVDIDAASPSTESVH